MFRLHRRECMRTLAGIARLGFTGSVANAGSMALPNENPATGGTITDVPGIRVGHFTDKRRPTGCTAILFDTEASVGVDYDGSAPGSSLGVLLQPVSPINTIHAMLLTGVAFLPSPP